MFKNKYAKLFLHSAIIMSIWGSITLICFVAYCSFDLPDVIPSLKPKEVNIGIFYNDGQKMRSYGSYEAQITNYAEFPLHLIDALIATEDRKFFKHGGFDYFGILRALTKNLLAWKIKEGGSTITQQLAKIILQNNKKTIKRKVQELILAFQLEKKLTKEEILTIYLNKSYFGAGKTGIKSAANFYFNKPIANLRLEESAMLVGLLKAPSKYSPQNNSELSAKRTKQVILNMEDAGFIKSKDYDLKYAIEKAVENSNETPDEYLYFSDWVRAQAKDYTNAEDIKIKTTLKQKMQSAIEDTIKETDIKTQIAVVAIDKSGAVVGMAGGNNYHKSEFNRAVYSSRQTGSAFKLFVFAAGIENEDYTPDSKFVDEPVAVGNWFPKNYNDKYYGKVSLKESFAKSLNSVAVQINEFTGLKKVAEMAKKMGIISSIDVDDPTTALGTTQVSLLELTSGYAVIVNDGRPVIPYSIDEIKDLIKNETIYKRKINDLKTILSEKTIDYMKEILQETIANGTGRRAYIKGYKIGGKTGTTQNSADAWFVGYIDDVVIGVWVGNDDNSSITGASGGGIPAGIWRGIVEKWKK
ncbi:MAG: PBP1A family penicillin-binding protein [Rickettsiales bacterium]|jgi:penicillin-binding protein 1A|nr:PBP1A family penicillin-binding protein [Rickettsiales bacterium]